jgi:hypothetical protein
MVSKQWTPNIKCQDNLKEFFNCDMQLLHSNWPFICKSFTAEDGCKSPRLVLAALKHNIHFKAKHIPGKTNVIYDLLSRFSFQEAHHIVPWLNANPVVVPSHLLTL